MDDLIPYLQSLSPLLVYAAVLTIAYIENLFPPFPSDIVVVVAGSLIPIGRVEFITSLACATAGSTLGFMTMYKIGEWFGLRIIEQGKMKFLPFDAIKRVEKWFARFGYSIIIVNRFLAGTRAVVSFFAGMSELRFIETTVLSFLSAILWNAALLGLGYYLGENWEQIKSILSTYSEIVTALVILGILFVGVKFWRKKKMKESA